VHAVLNWLWQGCVVALAVAAVLRLLEPARAQVRYVVCWLALCFVFALPVVSLVSAVASPVVTPAAMAAPAAIVSVPNAWWTSTAMVITVWALWIGTYGTRLAVAALTLRRAKTRSRPFPATVEPQLLHWSRLRERGRQATLAISDRVRAAAVLGYGSPVIAVAPALVQHLEAHELDRIIVHEWAHVQRRDDLANALQVTARLIAGWHPAVWWIDRRLQIEREVACGEITVALTGSPKSYAACLVKLAGLPLVGPTSLPVPGAVSSSGLRTRIRSLVSQREMASPAWARGVAAAAVALLSALSLAIGGFRLVDAAVAPSSIDAPSGVVQAQAMQPYGLEPSSAIDQRELPITRTETGGVSRSDGQPPIASSRVDHRRVEPMMARAPEASDGARVPADSPGDVFVPIVPLESAPIDVSVALTTAPRMSSPATETQTRSPWNAAADAGIGIGRGSKNAGVATAGFFNRFARRIAGSF
jgi:beta-lactamase regulating signal transducer with metallopeptidase domain